MQQGPLRDAFVLSLVCVEPEIFPHSLQMCGGNPALSVARSASCKMPVMMRNNKTYVDQFVTQKAKMCWLQLPNALTLGQDMTTRSSTWCYVSIANVM